MGRISRHGVIAFASSLDQIGVFARNTKDAAMALRDIAGFDELDSTSIKEPVPDYLAEIENSALLKVGIPKEYSGMNPEVEAAIKSSLGKLGAECVEISLPHTEYALATYYIIVSAEACSNLARYDGVRYGYRAKDIGSLQELYSRTRDEGFGTEVKRRVLMGSYVLSAGYYDAYYKKAQQVRTLVIEDFRKAFASECDVIATATSPTTAFAPGEKNLLDMYRSDVCTVPASLAGLPAISVPVGLDSAGLPIGLQLIAPAFAETKLLQTACALESAVNFEVLKA